MDNSSQLTTNILNSSLSALQDLNSGTLQDPIDNAKLNARASSSILVNSTTDIIDANDGVTTLREAILCKQAIIMLREFSKNNPKPIRLTNKKALKHKLFESNSSKFQPLAVRYNIG